jgi:hypothetical protein
VSVVVCAPGFSTAHAGLAEPCGAHSSEIRMLAVCAQRMRKKRSGRVAFLLVNDGSGEYCLCMKGVGSCGISVGG